MARPAVSVSASAFALVAVAVASAAVAGTQNVTLTREVPDLDRWNYPFNSTPGARDSATSFGTIGFGFLDNHDAQFLIGFETDQEAARGLGVIPSGLGEARYEIVSARVTATIAVGGVFNVDTSYDSFATYLDPKDPGFVADADPAGRPIMLFGTGYRNGFGIEEGEQEYVEDTPFSPGGGMGPAPRVRSAFATDFIGGAGRDVSNNVLDRFEIVPFAIGALSDAGGTIAEGDPVPAEATVTFDLNVADANVAAYLQKGLDAGSVQLSITSLHFAAGGPGGGKGVTYPVYFTKEDALAVLLGQTPSLELEVNILPASGADLDGNGVVGSGDLAILLAAWGPCAGCAADLDGDGVVGPSDLAILLAAWG